MTAAKRLRPLILAALVAGLVSLAGLSLFSLPGTTQTASATGTVSLQVNELVDISVVDGSISITFQPQSTSSLYWFALNTADYMNVTENDTNVDVTLAVTDYTYQVPARYSSLGLQPPMLLFNISRTASFSGAVFYNATINVSNVVASSAQGNIDSSIFPNTITLSSGTTLSLDATGTLYILSIDLSSVAVQVDSSGNVIEFQPGSYYLCIGYAQYLDSNSNPYDVVFGLRSNDCTKVNFTESNADWALLSISQPQQHGLQTGVEDYVLHVNNPDGSISSFRVYSYDPTVPWIVLKPALPLQYNGKEDYSYIFVVVRLPAAAPPGSYSFTVTMQTWEAQT